MGSPFMDPERSITKTTDRPNARHLSGFGGASATTNELRGSLGGGCPRMCVGLCCTHAATMCSAHVGIVSLKSAFFHPPIAALARTFLNPDCC